MKGWTEMFLEHGRHRGLIASALLMTAALLAACSGGDEETGPLTAAQAEAIAAEALLVVGDLPDADWQEADGQLGLEGLIPSGVGGADFEILPAACQALEDAIGDLPALLGDVTPLATSGRSFTAAGQLLDLQAVIVSVVVFEEAAGAEEAAAILDEAFSADSLEGCIQAAVLPAGGNSDIRITEFSLATPSYALDDSTALTATIDAIALIIPINLAVDLHAFQRDNLLALYVGLELNSSALADQHAGLLSTFADRAQEAQR